MDARQKLGSREEVAEKVAWEGGLIGALEYGLSEDEIPEGDEELRVGWHRMRLSWALGKQLCADVDKLLGRVSDGSLERDV